MRLDGMIDFFNYLLLCFPIYCFMILAFILFLTVVMISFILTRYLFYLCIIRSFRSSLKELLEWIKRKNCLLNILKDL